MKSFYTVLFAATAFATNSFAETTVTPDKQLQDLRLYMQCAQTVTPVIQYISQDYSKSVKTTPAAEHTDIFWSQKDNTNLQIRITAKDEVWSQVITSMDQPQSSLQPVSPEAKSALLTSVINAYRAQLMTQFKAVTPDVMAYAANQPAGFAVARDNFRKAFLSGHHPCDQIREKTFASAFATTEDTVLAGLIQMSQQARAETAQRGAANTRK